MPLKQETCVGVEKVDKQDGPDQHDSKGRTRGGMNGVAPTGDVTFSRLVKSVQDKSSNLSPLESSLVTEQAQPDCNLINNVQGTFAIQHPPYFLKVKVAALTRKR